MQCLTCKGTGKVEYNSRTPSRECPACLGEGEQHCPYCDEYVQLKGEELIAVCPECGVLEGEL